MFETEQGQGIPLFLEVLVNGSTLVSLRLRVHTHALVPGSRNAIPRENGSKNSRFT